MAAENDWRLDFVKRLAGQTFRWKTWPDTRDHDHCVACHALFCSHVRCQSLKEGYAVTEDYPQGEDYVWVCKKCFEELRDSLSWNIVAE